MPAIDTCEPQIIHALEKDGWEVTDHTFPIRVSQTKRFALADLRLTSNIANSPILIVEVKCFPSSRSLLDEIYKAIGQYQVYRSAMILRQVAGDLYLAMPDYAYQQIQFYDAVHHTLVYAKISIITIDLSREEITEWITH